MSRLIHGDCLDVLRTLPDCTVDAVVTDPPAGIAFMGKAWDGNRGGRDQWVAWLAERLAECLRVLKPGGHAVVWALPRTSGWTHRALEDAGFEVRDCLTHLFGSGFPKSLDVGKAIDKQRDDRSDILTVTRWLNGQRRRAGMPVAAVLADFGFNAGSGQVGHWTALTVGAQPAVPTWDQWLRLRDLLGFGDEMDAEVWRLNGRKGTPGEAWEQREVVGHLSATRLEVAPGEGRARPGVSLNVTAPATDAAREWDGWGTALKPAAEFWYLARKPLAGTVAQTVVEWGTGALNVDATRVAGPVPKVTRGAPGAVFSDDGYKWQTYGESAPHAAGRWPANVALTHHPDCDGDCVDGCPVAELDRQSGTLKTGASRFFPTFRPSECAHWCMLSGWKCSNATIAGDGSALTDAPSVGSAHEPATTKLDDSTVRLVASAGNLCKPCATSIARMLALTAQGHSSKLPLGLPSMDAFSERTLIQNLALCAEALGSSDTTSITASLTTSLGCVVSVISACITKESAPSTNGSDQFVPYKYQAKPSTREKNGGLDGLPERHLGNDNQLMQNMPINGNGNPQARVLPRKNHHPTVKPVELMRWLIRLITPPGGVVLDPFAGSGTTLVAATLEGFDAIGVEHEAEYLPIIEGRIRWAEAQQPALPLDEAS